MTRSKSDRAFRWLSRVFLLLLALSVALPLVLAVSVSLESMNDIYAARPVIIPRVFHFENYKTALQSGNWARYFYNSAVIAIVTVVVSLFINSMSGYVFARIPFRGRDALFVLILLGMMIPTQVTLIPVFSLLKRMSFINGSASGLINTYAGLILPFIAGSFGVFLCRQFYVSFPKALDDAAMIDGCGRFRTYAAIYLPLSGPVLASLGVLKFTGTWNEYTWPLVATSGDQMKTVQVALSGFRDEGEIYWNLLMAATLVAGLPIFIVFFFAQKQFVSGLLAGSVKA